MGIVPAMAIISKSDSAETDSGRLLPESRFFQIPAAMVLDSAQAVKLVRLVADAGFNGIVTPLTYGAMPLFPSETPKLHDLPKPPPELRRRDVLGEIAAAATEKGLCLHGEIDLWGPGGDMPASKALGRFRKKMDWFAQGLDSSGKPQGRPDRSAPRFCMLNADRRGYLGDLLSEAIEAYPISGLIFSPPHVLWPLDLQCCCKTCVESAQENGELDLSLLSSKECDERMLKAWRRWRSRNAQAAIGYYCLRCHKLRHDLLVQCRISGAEPPESDEESSTALDTHLSSELGKAWQAEGLIDSLDLEGLPLEDGEFVDSVQRNLAICSDDALLIPIIQASEPEHLSDKIKALRRHPITGCIVEWQGDFTAVAAKQLAGGCLSREAFVAEERPLRSVKCLFKEISRLAPKELGISEFLAASLAFAHKPVNSTMAQALETMVENLRGLEARILQGQLDFGGAERLALCRLSQAKRLARLACNRTGI